MWCQVRATACPGLGSPLGLLASFPYPPHPLLPSTGAFSHPPSPIFPTSPSPPSSGPSSFSSYPLSPLSLSFVTLPVCGAGLGFPAGLLVRRWLLSTPRAYCSVPGHLLPNTWAAVPAEIPAAASASLPWSNLGPSFRTSIWAERGQGSQITRGDRQGGRLGRALTPVLSPWLSRHYLTA